MTSQKFQRTFLFGFKIFMIFYEASLQTFIQTNGELIKSRIIYPPTSPSAHKVGKNVSWVYKNLFIFDHYI